MATEHREPNRVKWIGVRPGHEGEQVLIHIDFAVNTLLYTVAADKLLLLFDWQITLVGNVAAGAYLSLRTAVPATYYHLGYASSTVGAPGQFASNSLNVPIEVPATYNIYLTTTQTVRGGIHGILIDV